MKMTKDNQKSPHPIEKTTEKPIITTLMKTQQIQGTKTPNRAQREDATVDRMTNIQDETP